MISVYQLKPKFQQLLQPLLLLFKKWGFTPNSLTVLAFLLSLGMGLFSYFGPRAVVLWLLPLCLLLRMALNALDGMMARQFEMQSKLGAILNEMGDLLSDIVLYYPLYVLFEIDPLWIHGFIVLGLINEFAGLLALGINGERRYDGPMGKSDRALLIGVFSLLLYLGLPSVYISNTVVWLVIYGLVLWSTFKRLKHAL